MTFDLFVVLLAFIIVVIITSCTTEPLHQYNSNDAQNYSCYNDFGGKHGYCDMRGNTK